MASNNISVIPYSHDPVKFLCQKIFSDHTDRLPLLTSIILLTPDYQAHIRIRKALIDQAMAKGFTALLGPHLYTLKDWIGQQYTLPEQQELTDAARELILVNALRRFPKLLNEPNPWHLSESLLELFDQLTQNLAAVPDDFNQFTQALRNSYGVGDTAVNTLNREARLVHTLWHAWHQDLAQNQQIDPSSVYVQQLSNAFAKSSNDCSFYIIANHSWNQAERIFIKHLLNTRDTHLVVQGNVNGNGYHPDAPNHRLLQQLDLPYTIEPESNDLDEFFNTAYDVDSQSLLSRAQTFRHKNIMNPLRDCIHTFRSTHSEQEARAVELQVRRWLLENHRNIGIVTEDRKLARRIRALLERTGIQLQDTAGWALSTTRAAATLECWLETIEEDFAYQPLLDFIKSPLFILDNDDNTTRKTVYRFEQDIILHENITRDLNRYRHHIHIRQRRLGWSSEHTESLLGLLNCIEIAARPLQQLNDSRSHPVSDYLQALLNSLELLNLWQTLQSDSAGFALIQQLNAMQQGAVQEDLSIQWSEFRAWLARRLERAYFRPYTATSPVQLLSLEQTQVCRFDALIIAAADNHKLPGKTAHSPYFNDAVRKQLGLADRQELLSRRLYNFRRLLQCADKILITYTGEQQGEEILPSPWLEILQTFYHLTYNADLHDHTLEALLDDPENRIVAKDRSSLPGAEQQPRPCLDPRLIPQQLTVSAHQRLINCPYLFFVADCLELQALEEIKLALAKSDYGSRVHRCLEAFHTPIENLPKPFNQALDTTTRDHAIDHLEHISRTVFAQDLEDNFMHRGWLKRWLDLIPAYIDWQIRHQADGWRVSGTETEHQTDLINNRILKGRLDRIDTQQNGTLGIVDYKTGSVPHQTDIDLGEAIQLPSYAVFCDKAQRVEYLQLDSGKVHTEGVLEGEDLLRLTGSVQSRLNQMLRLLEKGHPLPAWGDELTCTYCKMQGICRRQSW